MPESHFEFDEFADRLKQIKPLAKLDPMQVMFLAGQRSANLNSQPSLSMFWPLAACLMAMGCLVLGGLLLAKNGSGWSPANVVDAEKGSSANPVVSDTVAPEKDLQEIDLTEEYSRHVDEFQIADWRTKQLFELPSAASSAAYRNVHQRGKTIGMMTRELLLMDQDRAIN